MTPSASLSAAMPAGAARTAGSGPLEGRRGTVLLGDGDLDLLPFAGDERTAHAAGFAAPADLLCAALAASCDAAIRQAAEAEGVVLASLEVAARAWRDGRAERADGPEAAPALQAIECRITCVPAHAADAPALPRVLARAERNCAVLATLRRATCVRWRCVPAGAALALAA